MNRGSQLILAIIITTLVGVLGSASSSLVTVEIKKSKEKVAAERAFEIAEAGIEYYRWHLAHDQDDFQDGTGSPGPYIHEFKDKDGIVIGSYTLTITPPEIGSTVVTIKSTGVLNVDPNIKRSVEARLGISSWAKF